jgi:hypothetical protein
VDIVNVTEFHRAINQHVEFLQNEIKKAEKAKEKIRYLSEIENNLITDLEKVEIFGMFYEKFWEEKIPHFIKEKNTDIMQGYKELLNFLQQEIDNYRDFDEIMKESETIRIEIEELSKKTRNLLHQFDDLFEDIKRYLNAGSMFVKKFRENVVPRLVKSDKNKIEKILEALATLYDGTLIWLDEVLRNFIVKINEYISNPIKTRSTLLEEERRLRETLIKEIKDLDKNESLILLKIVEVSASRRTSWLPLTEICEVITEQMGVSYNETKETILKIAEKGFLSLAVGF